MTSQVRFLHNQIVFEDDRKLCEYSLPEGATISALFEPDVNISIDVSTSLELHNITITNATSVMAIKVHIFLAVWHL